MKKYILMPLTSLLLISCSGEDDKKEPREFIKVKINTEKLNEEAKREVDKVIEDTEENIRQLQEEVEKSVKNVEEQTKAVEEALNALEEEFKEN